MSKAITLLFALWTALPGHAAAPAITSGQFQSYVDRVEERLKQEHQTVAGFLPSLQDPDQRSRLLRGDVLVEKVKPPEVEDGLIHHWTGTAFVRGATMKEVQAVTREIDRFPQRYAPEVIAARVVSRLPHGEGAVVAMRLKKSRIITVVLDAEYEVRFGGLDQAHRFSASRSSRIQEVRDAGTPRESVVPPDENHGFLWAMNAYWTYVQADDGVYIRCESLSLSRDIPLGMGWLAGPVVERMPRESLRSTLNATRRAVEEAAKFHITENTQ